MKYNISINQAQAIELGIKNTTEAIILDVLSVAPTWADAIIIDNSVYYWTARSKIAAELPLLNLKDDTVYRHLKSLEKNQFIDYQKFLKKDCTRLTKKGKKYITSTISEKNPNSYVGKKSEKNSEKNPTDNNTRFINKSIEEEDEEELKKKISIIEAGGIEADEIMADFLTFVTMGDQTKIKNRFIYTDSLKKKLLKGDTRTINNFKTYLKNEMVVNWIKQGA